MKKLEQETNLLFESVLLLSFGAFNAEMLQLLLVTLLFQFNAILDIFRHLLLTHL